MTKLQTATYQPDDLSKLVDFIFRIRKPEELPQFPTRVDLEELMDSRQIRELTQFWLDDSGNIAGYAFIDPRFCNLDFEVEPVRDTVRLQKEIIPWGIETFKQLKSKGKVAREATLDTNCNERDTLRVELLKSFGFIPRDLMTLHLTRCLSDPIPPVALPAGFTIRPVTGEDEVDAVTALFHAAYGSERMTREDILSIMRTSSYDRELDLVAISPDGRLIGLCTCGIEEDLNRLLSQKLGSTDPVLVHPDFQGLGLARALIWSGWEKLKTRGIQVAELLTSSHNEKGIAAFIKAGYRIDARRQWFFHPVS
jgi:ribosomal protein S18 acetylase RimI-like enzyme